SDGNDIKELVGHRKQRVEEKYGIPYIADVTAVQVHSANALPAVDKSIWNDEAWWKRWRIIKFNGHFAKDISWAERNLDTDFLEGLLILAIAESCAIIRRGNRLRLDQPWNEVQDMWIGGESRFHEFYTESFCECPGNTIQRQTVLDSLKEWFDRYMTIPENVSAWAPGDIVRWRDTQWNLLPTTIPTLTAAMKREGAGVKQASSAHAQGGAARPYVFKDIAFKPTAVWEIRPVYVSSVPDTGGGVK
ncbi:MAG TPA: hypothetical protein O0X27_06245, partial [Methanocorpusculum sp.]|nr:hypothetical protein [Methanocorpusculum sp.]